MKRITELQPSYSSDNTDEMKERGALIRRELPEALRDYLPELRPELGKYGADLAIDASDGIGRKTEAPWVRLASKELSPTRVSAIPNEFCKFPPDVCPGAHSAPPWCPDAPRRCADRQKFLGNSQISGF
jgi:hypothetical protein